MTTARGSDIPLGRLGMVTLRGMIGKLGIVIPLGKLGGLMPRGRELRKVGIFTPCGMLGNMEVPGITPEISRWRRRPEEMEDVWGDGEVKVERELREVKCGNLD